MSMREALESAAKTNVFNYSGRASRSEYWWYVLFYYIIIIAFGIAIMGDEHSAMADITLGVVCLTMFVPFLSLTVRRLHDIGKSAWWLLVAFVPYVGAIILLIFTLMPSENHPNQYGPVPNV